MRDAIERLDRWLAENRPEYYKQLNPGATDEEVADLEKSLGSTLPEEFKAFLKWRNGQGRRNFKSFYYNYQLMDAKEIAGTVQGLNDLLAAGDFDQVNWWSPQWVPFLRNGGGDNYCIDMGGSFGGTKGQVLEFNHDYESREIHNASFADWLETTVQALEKGFLVDDEYGWQPTEEFDGLAVDLNPGYPIRMEAG